jgi:hypothetical protein
MDCSDLVHYARNLYDAHGGRAEAEAAQKAAAAREAGKADDAAKWDKIRAHIRDLRGAHQI